MFTQCPHCLTLFRIRSDQLKIAGGKVRCSQCHQPFNALDSLQETPSNWPMSEPSESEDAIQDWIPLSESNSLNGDTLNLDLEHRYDAANIMEGLEDSELRSFLEQDDGLEPEPDYMASTSESLSSSLLDSESSPMISLVEAPVEDSQAPSSQTQQDETKTKPQTITSLPKRDATGTSRRDGNPPRHPLPAERPPVSLSAFTKKVKQEASVEASPEVPAAYTLDQMFEKEPVHYRSLGWGLGSLLLACALILQLAWHNRDQLVHNQLGRQLLTQMCEILDCTAPVPQDTSKIQVEYRDLRSHPSVPSALLLQLRIVNHAKFAQVHPRLHLSLFNDAERLIADRTFLPAEYLPSGQGQDGLMPSAQSVQISLELLDPGKDVTGFKFDFL
jgi:predicted Zn finger-like uncharacterized protein